jgi:YVTN family beta-propeller protein
MGVHLVRGLLLLAACLLVSVARAEVAIVLNSGEGTVSVIDKARYTEISRTFVGREPHHLMSLPDNSALIVANSVSNDLVFLDPLTGAIKSRLPNISDPYQIAFSPDRHWFATTSLRLDRVDLYQADGFHLVKRFSLPTTPSHLAFDRQSGSLFVTLQGSDELVAIDLKTQAVRWKIPVGKTPAGVVMTPDDQYLLIGVMGEDHVAVVDWRKAAVVKTIPTGKGAHNLFALGDGRRFLVSNRVANTVSILDSSTLTVESSFPVPGGPDCMELSADGRELWVTSRWLRQVSVIDMGTHRLTHVVPVGRSPHGIFFATHVAR